VGYCCSGKQCSSSRYSACLLCYVTASAPFSCTVHCDNFACLQCSAWQFRAGSPFVRAWGVWGVAVLHYVGAWGVWGVAVLHLCGPCVVLGSYWCGCYWRRWARWGGVPAISAAAVCACVVSVLPVHVCAVWCVLSTASACAYAALADVGAVIADVACA
jgi:hypothetical protein